MKLDDLLWGAHSAIQKGVRRGDLDLVKTSFDLMWGRKQHRSWLKWRAAVIVLEEVWYMAGELFKLLDKKTDDPKEWKKFFYKLALVPKSKDVGPLFFLKNKSRFSAYKEMDIANRWFKAMTKDGTGPATIVDKVLDELQEFHRFTPYEEIAVEVYLSRMKQGGMFGDRCGCLSSIILIACRSLDEKEILRIVSDSVKKYKESGGEKPKTIEMPWYNFDMHTLVGKTALGIYLKKHGNELGIERKDLTWLWFFMESGYIPKENIIYTKPKRDSGKFYETFWWPYFLKEFIEFGGRTAKENKKMWDESIKSHIKGLVEWLLKKRSQEKDS